MKMLMFVLVVIVLSTAVVFAVWRLRPGIPGLLPSNDTDRVQTNWGLWICFLLSGLAFSSAVAVIAGDARESTMGYLRIVLSDYAGEDSWMPMRRASQQLQEHTGDLLYQVVFFAQHVKFQYPLTALVPLDLPHRLFDVSTESVITAFKILSRLCLPVIAWVFLKLFMGATREGTGGAMPLPKRATAALFGLSLLSVALFYPLVRSEYHGQIQTAMTLAAAVALLAWQRGQPKLSGAMIAVCCIIKPQWAVVIVWALLRRQWAFAVTAAVLSLACLLVAVAMYGLANVLDYLPVISFLGQHGESYFINQSINGLMHRALFNGVNLQGAGLIWSGTDFPPYNALVYAVTTVTSALILLASIVWRITRKPTTLDLAIVLLSLTIASPIAWDHHYAVLLPIFAVAFPAALRLQPWGRWTLPLLWVIVALSAQSFVQVTNLLAATHFNFLQSYQLAGALLALTLLYRLTWQEEGTASRWPGASASMA